MVVDWAGCFDQFFFLKKHWVGLVWLLPPPASNKSAPGLQVTHTKPQFFVDISSSQGDNENNKGFSK